MIKKVFSKIPVHMVERTRYFLLILFLLSITNSLNASSLSDDIIFQHLNIENGLSQNTGFCIYQDGKGFMWFGTEDGLNRYNGYKFKVFKKDLKDSTSITTSYILSMHEDRDGVLWVGTDGGGLNQYDRNKENFVSYMNIAGDKNTLSNDRVRSICSDISGNIWIATGGGLDKYNPQTQEFSHYKNDAENPNSISSNNVYTVMWDKDGFLWVGTDNGLNKFDPANEAFLRFFANSRDPSSLSFNYILCLFQDSKGVIWVGTFGGGLNKLINSDKKGSDPSFISFKNDYKNPASISGDVITSIFEDKSGVLWIGTDGNGLNKLITGETEKSNAKFSHYKSNPSDPSSIGNDQIISIYEDRSGVLWIGTKGGGISKYDREKKNFFVFRSKANNPNSISNNAVRVFYEDRLGDLWIGTDGGGLDRYNEKTDTYTNYRNIPSNSNSLSHDYIRSIKQDQKGNMWIGTDSKGINKIDIKTGKFTRYQYDPDNPHSLSYNTVRPIFVDHKGLIWIGTLGGGLNRYDPETNKFIHYNNDPNNPKSLTHNSVYVLYEDRLNEMWIGTDGGGFSRYNRDEDSFENFRHDPDNPNSLKESNIYSIYDDNSGILWLGSRGGLNKFDKEKHIFTLYTEKDGLPNSTIYGILGDQDGNLWLSTNNGISKFDPKNESFKNYDVNDGLQSNEFNGGAYFKSKDGAMYFGGINGMNKFYPNDIKDNPNIPPVVITSFQIFNKPVPIAEELDGRIILEKSIVETNNIELSYKDKVFSFEFAALNYAAPDKNQYAYMMENFEKEWSYIGERKFASYTNLPAGDYIFRVKGSNGDGVWNEAGTSLKLTITPPFWQTWWFRSIVLIFVLLAVYSFYLIRVRSIKERSRELEENVKKRTKQATLLYETGQRLSSELDLNSLLSEIVNTICEAFNYYGVMLLLTDNNNKTLSMRSIAGGFKEVFSDNLKLKFGEGMIGKAASTRKIQVSGDVSKETNYIQKAGEKTRSELSVPILNAENLIGVLDIQSDKLNAFEKSDIAALETLSSQIASAIDNARLYDQAQQEIKERERAQMEVKKSHDSLEKSKKQTDNILQNVKDGLFLLDENFKIESQYSAALEKIFEEKNLGKKSLIHYVEKRLDDEKIVENVVNYLTLLAENKVDEEMLSELNPLSQIELSYENPKSKDVFYKFLSFDFRRIIENDKTINIIATVNDITEKIHLERVLEETKNENKRKIDLMLCVLNVDPVMLSDFLNSAYEETEQIEKSLETFNYKKEADTQMNIIYRLVHNIKGNASLLELGFFADRAHLVENYIQEIKGSKKFTSKHIKGLIKEIESLRLIQQEIKEFIAQIGEIRDHFRPNRSHEHNIMIKSLKKLVDSLNTEHKKKTKLISEKFKGDVVPNNYRLLVRDVLVQLVRNSIYHGIEKEDERKEKGKEPVGAIEIECYKKDNNLILFYHDDGRGIDLEKLRKKAIEMGKWTKEKINKWNDNEIAEVIYIPGITTLDQANMDAGRGMGMDIIKSKILKNNGSIAIEFSKDKFCNFSITLPLN